MLARECVHCCPARTRHGHDTSSDHASRVHKCGRRSTYRAIQQGYDCVVARHFDSIFIPGTCCSAQFDQCVIRSTIAAAMAMFCAPCGPHTSGTTFTAVVSSACIVSRQIGIISASPRHAAGVFDAQHRITAWQRINSSCKSRPCTQNWRTFSAKT